MNHRNISWTLPLCLLMALLAAFIFTSPAFAQDEVPPNPEETPVEPNLAEILAEAGVVLSDESGEPVSLATDEVAQLLAGNDPWFKVGTTKYSYMFDTECPVGTLGLNCFESANPIQSAVDDIFNGVFTPTDGTLYFDGGSTYNVDQVVISETPALKKLVGATDPATGEPTVTINLGSYFGIYNQAAFTLSGFNIYGDTTLDGEDYGALDIWGNSGTLTLTDLVVRNYAADGTGIIINDHTGAVVLQNVDSSNNQGGGLYINNYDGSIAPITIKNSSFNDNNGNSSFANGISISTRGAVTLDGVSASGNDGVYIEPELGDQSLAALQLWDSGNLIIKNSVFNHNGSWAINTYNHPTGTLLMDNVYANWNLAGVGLDPKGNITISGLHADGNDHQGASLDTCWEDHGVCTNPGTGNVVISYSSFSNNASNFVGLFVNAKGAITLNNMDASWNRGYDRDSGDPTFSTAGARLTNTQAASAYPVTVNSSSFNWNSEDGLEIYSKGLVTINKVQTQDNSIEYDEFGGYIASHDGYGLEIDNTMGTTAGVTLKGTNWGDNDVSRNSYGLHILSNGTVLVGYLNSYDNSHTNTVIDNSSGTGAVTLSNAWFNHSYWGDGVDIFSRGAVTLNSVSAEWNAVDGIYINNRSATPKPVTINSGSARGNGENGLTIWTNGAITIKDFWSEENGSWGAYLTNYDSVTPVPVTMSNSAFKGNSGEGGLYVQSKGAVKLTNVGASENSYRGGDILFDDVVSEVVGNQYGDNWWFDGLQDQVINFGLIRTMHESWGEFNLTLYDTDGNYLTSTNYNGDDYNYAILDYALPYDGQFRIEVNYWGDASGAYDAYFWQGSGDYAGAGIVSDWGWVRGAYIDNTGGAGVTITNPIDSWDYKFNFNTNYGLQILSKGAVKLTNVNASSNVGFGARVNNKDVLATGGITVAGSSFKFNGEFGLDAQTNGVVSITKTQAYRNNGIGLNIDNIPLAGTANPAVTIVNDAGRVEWGDHNFRNNGDGGLLIISRGTITLTNVNASNNGYIGAQINNAAGTADVKITNGYFYENSHNGLDVQTKGNIIYTKGRAENNWNGEYDGAGRGIGLNLTVLNDLVLKNITISEVNLNNNFKYGLVASTRGNITLTRVWAENNWGYEAGGALLDNLNGTGNILITNSSFNYNNFIGLELRSKGNITLNNVSVDGNRHQGAIVGSFDDPVKAVSILGKSHFNGNQNTGLEVHATGAITLANVDAGNNGGNGAYLNNTYGTLPANVSLLATLANWTNWYGDNGWNIGGSGIEIITHGAVVLNKLDASNNEFNGVAVSNETAGTPANVTINNGWINNNRNGGGLVITSKGTVLLNGVSAYDNRNGAGALIDNRFDTTSTKSVTVNKSDFSNNQGSGLLVYSTGNIVVNGVIAMNNYDGAPGVSLNNNEGSGTVSVLSTLGWNVFNNNDASGLGINSSRAVIISGVTAEGSRSGYGITIDNNQAGGGIGNVTLSKVYANFNRFEGLMIETNGVASIAGSSVMFNGLDDWKTVDVEIANGITIYSHNALCKVSITGSTVIGNGANGIRIYKYGGPAPAITTTAYFGNNANNAGYSNLLITD